MFVVGAAAPQASGMPSAAKRATMELVILAYNAANELCDRQGDSTGLAAEAAAPHSGRVRVSGSSHPHRHLFATSSPPPSSPSPLPFATPPPRRHRSPSSSPHPPPCGLPSLHLASISAFVSPPSQPRLTFVAAFVADFVAAFVAASISPPSRLHLASVSRLHLPCLPFRLHLVCVCHLASSASRLQLASSSPPARLRLASVSPPSRLHLASI